MHFRCQRTKARLIAGPFPVFIVSVVSSLEDLEVHFYCQLDFDWFAVLGGGLELVLADGFDGFLIQSHTYAAGHLDMRRISLLIDP